MALRSHFLSFWMHFPEHRAGKENPSGAQRNSELSIQRSKFGEAKAGSICRVSTKEEGVYKKKSSKICMFVLKSVVEH